MSEVEETTIEALEAPVETPEVEAAPPVITPEPEQERINQAIQKRLAREQRKHERDMDELRRQRDEALAARQTQTATPQPSAGAPKLDDFPTYEVYRQAATRWEIKEELRQERERESQTASQREAQKKAADWKARESKAMDTIHDYEDVADLNKLQREGAMNPAMAQAVLESDFGPQLLYALSKDVDTARRLASMPPAKALLELGRMEGQFYTTPTRQTTNAPTPITPLSGARGTGTVDPAKLSDADYVRQRRAEYQAKQAQRLPLAQRGRR